MGGAILFEILKMTLFVVLKKECKKVSLLDATLIDTFFHMAVRVRFIIYMMMVRIDLLKEYVKGYVPVQLRRRLHVTGTHIPIICCYMDIMYAFYSFFNEFKMFNILFLSCCGFYLHIIL